jgi:Glutathione S-transferase, N-terminal domain
MSPTITAFKQSPDGGQGQARDMRVRWALEEVGQAYDVRLVTFAQMKEPAHLAVQPFGQIPSFEDGDLALFESGAIVLHLAQNHAGLLPTDTVARGRAIAWMFAALNTVEPPIVELEQAYFSAGKKAWYAEYRAIIVEQIRDRLDRLSHFSWRCRVARRSVQRRRPHDGHGAAAGRGRRHNRNLSEPACLYGARHSAARIPTGLRRAARSVRASSGGWRIITRRAAG